MNALNDHGVGTNQNAVLHNDRGGRGRLHDARQHRAGADVAARTHRGPTAQDGSHVNHGARAHDGANINHRAHHDDRALSNFHLFPDDGTGFNAGWNLPHIQ